MDITFLVPFKGIAGGLRVVTCYGNALIRRGHRVTVVYPKRDLAFRERLRRKIRRMIHNERDHLDAFCGTLIEAPKIAQEYLPHSDCIIATAFQTAQIAAELPERCGRKFYLIQGYEKVFAREGEDVDATLEKNRDFQLVKRAGGGAFQRGQYPGYPQRTGFFSFLLQRRRDKPDP